MQIAGQIMPCLWFDNEAEEAAKFYVSIFKNSKIRHISRYGKAGQKIHRKKPGSVMVVEFEINGQIFTALNGGPNFEFSEAVSFQVPCENQQDIDYFWSKLSAGGTQGPCGWLKDKYGLSWQVFPKVLRKMLMDSDADKSGRVTNAFMKMKKLDIAKLEQAYRGKAA